MTHKTPHLSLTTIKRYSLAFLLLLTSNFAFAAGTDDFVTTWRGTSIVLPISHSTDGSFSVTVDWGDGGNAETFTAANPTHTYTDSPATHSVTVSGSFDRFNLGDSNSDTANDAKLISVTQWGTTQWSTMVNAFSGAANLSIPTSAGAPDLSAVTSMSSMFLFSSFNSDINHWNVSNVTSMRSMFSFASSFNQDLNNWDVSSVDAMTNMFFTASAFNGNISSWNVSSVTGMGGMFANAVNFNQNIGAWDVSNALNIGDMFNGATNFNQDIGAWNVANATNIVRLFDGATAFDQNLGRWYIVPSAIEINNTVGEIISINPQNPAFTASVHAIVFVYELSAATAGNDNARFTITDEGVLTLNAPVLNSVASYQVSIVIIGGYSSPNQSTLTLSAVVPGSFVSRWQTSVANDAIVLPISGNNGVNATINWGDGSIETIATANPSHTYTSTGIYSVSISGTFDRFNLGDSGSDNANDAKLVSVIQWGTTQWRTMENAFQGATNLTIPATTDAPDLSVATNMSSMFNAATNFNTDISHWDVSNIENMDNMFENAVAFNQNLGNWYIEPSSTSTLNVVGATLTISAQNDLLNTDFALHISPTYVLSDQDADNARFSLSPNGVLTLNTPTLASNYEISIISTNGFERGTNTFIGGTNQAIINLKATVVSPNISASVSRLTVPASIAITPITITSNAGIVSRYSINPAISNGLSFDISTGVISGTPSASATATVYTITATNDAGVDTATVIITVNPADTITPTFTSDATATADENIGTNQVVYTAQATDTYTISYSLGTGGDETSFTINPMTGAVSLTINPDFETAASYTFVVTASDTSNNAAAQTVTLTIANVNDAPVITVVNTGTAAKIPLTVSQITTSATTWQNGNTAQNIARVIDGNKSTAVNFGNNIFDDFQVHPQDIDGGHFTFTLGQTYTDGSFIYFNRTQGSDSNNNINGAVVAFSNNGIPTYSEEITTATDEITLTPPADVLFDKVVITFNGDSQHFREIEIFGKATAFSAAENQISVPILITATDEDGTTPTFSLPSGLSDNNSLTISATAGTLTFNTAPDFETKASYTIVVRATDGGLFATQTIVISITDVNDAPTVDNPINDQTARVGIAFTFAIPTNTFTDADAGDTLTLSATSTLPTGITFTDGVFSGTPTIAGTTTSVVVTASDGDLMVTATFDIVIVTLTDTTAPTITSGATTTATTIAENSGAGQVIYTVTATDTSAITYYLTNAADGGLFTIGETSGSVTLTANPNFEGKASYTFVVSVRDTSDNVATQTVTLAITDVNETPTLTTAILDQTATVNEAFTFTIPANTFNDVDAGDTLTYTATPLPNGITLTNGVFSGAPTTVGTTLVVVTASDGTLTVTATFDISVSGHSDTTPPSFTSGTTATAIDEDSGTRQVIYTAVATDNSAVTYSLGTGNDNAEFSINASTGSVTLTADPNFEAKASYTFNVIAADSANNTATRTVILSITNIDEVGSIANIAGNLVIGQTLTAGDITDPDGGVTTITYQWQADGSNIAGATNATYILTTAQTGTTITVVVIYTDNHGAGKTATSAPTAVVTINQPPPEFITTWRTTTANEGIVLPISYGTPTTFNVTIDWGDGATETFTTANPTHTYAATGTHSVSVSGTFDRIHLGDSNNDNDDKLIAIAQWGTTPWRTMQRAFDNADNLSIPRSAGAPDLSAVTDMSFMFTQASNFNNDIDHWNVANVQNMSSMFSGASAFDKDLNSWNVAAVTNMDSMFFNALEFNQNISNWNVSSVTNMVSMFENAQSFNQDISNWNVSKVMNMDRMFVDAHVFNKNIGSWNVAAVTNMDSMFFNALEFNQNISNWNVSAAMNMADMFSNAPAFSQNLGNWYIVPSDTSINNAVGQIITISAQNTVLNTPFTGHIKPTYNLSGTDAGKFSINGNVLTLTTPTASVAYKVVITSTGGFTKVSGQFTGINQKTIMLTANAVSPIISTSVSSLTVPISIAITPVTITSNVGEAARYSISPTISNGLSFDTTTGAISGTPTASANEVYTITATNSAGNDTATVSITVIDPADNFITTWQTASNTDSIVLPISHSTAANFNVTINWGDGATDTGVTTPNPAHTYIASGTSTYTVTVSGSFDRFNLGDSDSGNTNDAKLLAVTQWGTTQWRTMERAFRNADSLNIPRSAGTPNLTAVRSMALMFNNAYVFNSDIGHWDVSKVTSMDNMFSDSPKFNQDIGNWNTSAVTNMGSMFRGNGTFNQNISNWNVSAVQNMSGMFYLARGFNQDISNWDVSAVTNMESMFNDADAFNQNLGKWYIKPSSTSILNLVGAILTISTQNAVLNTGFDGHSDTPTYTLSGTDANKFTLANGVLTLNTLDSSATIYTLTITSTGGFSSPNQRTLILSVLIPPVISISTNTLTVIEGIAITPITIDSTAGGAVAGYSISPNLSGGLVFNTSTGRISGTPTEAATRRTYTITATNDDGSDTATVIITVLADSDGDSIPDNYENANGLNSAVNDANGDLDGDGFSNLYEYTNNTDPDSDEQAPVFATISPAQLIAKGRRSAFSLDSFTITATDGTGATAVDIIPSVISVDGSTNVISSDSHLVLLSGSHTLVWQAQDTTGNTAIAMQRVEVTPLVGFSQSRQSGEAGTFTITAVLTGDAVTYPVTTTFDGGTITFNSGRVGTTTLSAVNASRMVSITTASNAEINSANRTQTIVVYATLPLRIANFKIVQGAATGRVVRAGAGDVTITAETTGATRTYAWSIDGNTPTTTANPLIIEEINISEGITTIQLVLTDGSSSTTRTFQLRVLGATATVTVVAAAADSNNNGVRDTDETQVTSNIELLIGTQTDRVITTSRGKITTGVIAGNYGVITVAAITAFEEANGQTYSADSFTTGEIYDYSVENIEIGGTVSIVIELASDITDSANVRKYDLHTDSAGWGAFATEGNNAYYSTSVIQGASCPNAAADSWGNANQLKTGDNCLQLVIQDGGANDSDDIANGVIDDPFTVTSDSSGSGGSGCVLNTKTSANNATFDPMLYTLLGLALLALFRRKKATA